MNILVTGGAGFIGSSLVRSLLWYGHDVTILDNFSSGKIENLSDVKERINIIKGDCTNQSDIHDALHGQDVVFHLAANPEVRIEFNNSQNCFRQNVYATHLLMEEIATSTAKTVVFTSTSTVYGEPTVIPTPETYGDLRPISFYGASKLASEALVSSYCSMHKKKGVILRFANVIGPQSNHGVIFDFIQKLKSDRNRLEVLGDGKQTKSYLYIQDCISAMLRTWTHAQSSIEILNIGTDDKVSVTEIAGIVTNEINPDASITYTGGIDGGRGWLGDVKVMQLDTTKICSLGWKPNFSSREAIVRTVKDYLKSSR